MVRGAEVTGAPGPSIRGQRAVGPELLAALEQSRRLFALLRDVEEAYDVVMGNYLDLEDTVLRLCARELAQRHNYGRLDHFDTARRACHRALANLLSSGRAFDDVSCAALSALYGKNSAQLGLHKASFNRAYDASLGYRVMVGLRNHAQHQGLSVSGVSFGRRVGLGDGSGRELWVSPYIRLEELRRSPKFKAALVREIEAWLGPPSPSPRDEFDVIPFVRAYISGLAGVIMDARGMLRDAELEAETTVYSAFHQYTGFFTQGADVRLEVAEEHDGQYVAHAVFGTSQLIAARLLREVNGPLTDLTKSTIVQ